MENNIILLLTATIDTKNCLNSERNDKIIREKDYHDALEYYLQLGVFKRIIFCENSGSHLKKINEFNEKSNTLDVQLEWLYFNDVEFNPNLGKGLGESKIFNYVLNNSNFLDEESLILKITGRYKLKNVKKIISFAQNNLHLDVISDYRDNLKICDSRVFLFNVRFFKKYLNKFVNIIDEKNEIYFEHSLARAIHLGISDGLEWNMLPYAPIIEGYNGTTGEKIRTSLSKIIRQRYKARLFKY